MLWKLKIAILTAGLLAILVSCAGAGGVQGPPGVGINKIVSNGDGTLTLCLTDGSNYTTDNLTGPQGPKGDTGAPGPGLNPSYQMVPECAYQTTLLTWGDLPESYGPEVTVNITESGCAIVTLTAELIVPGNCLGFMSFSITGASDLGPDESRALKLVMYEHYLLGRIQTSGSFVVTGLNPGFNTFTATYYAAGAPCRFQHRTMIVQPLP